MNSLPPKRQGRYVDRISQNFEDVKILNYSINNVIKEINDFGYQTHIDDKVISGEAYNNMLDTKSEQSWLVENLIPTNSLILLSGLPAIGKTTLTTQLGYVLATGHDFLDYKTALSNVLYIVLNDPYRSMRVYTKHQEEYFGKTNNIRFLHPNIARKFTSIEDVSYLQQLINQYHLELVILDPLSRLGIKDENDSYEVDMMIEPFKNLINITNCSILLIHHLNKISGDKRTRIPNIYQSRGSSVIPAMADVVLTLSEPINGIAKLTVAKLRGSKEQGKKLMIKQDNFKWVIHNTAQPPNHEHTQRLFSITSPAQIIMEYLKIHPSLTANDIAYNTGIIIGTVKNNLTKLIKSKEIKIIKTKSINGWTQRYYSLSDS